MFWPPGYHGVGGTQARSSSCWLPSMGRKILTAAQSSCLSLSKSPVRESPSRQSLLSGSTASAIHLGPKENTPLGSCFTVVLHHRLVSTLRCIDGLYLLSACCMPGARLNTARNPPFFFIVVVGCPSLKCIILDIVTVQFTGMKFIHIVVQPSPATISRTFLSAQTETPYALNNVP